MWSSFLVLLAVAGTMAVPAPVNLMHFGATDVIQPGQPHYYLLADVDTPHAADQEGELRRTQRSFWKKLFKNTALEDLFAEDGCTNCCSNANNYNNNNGGYYNDQPISPFDPAYFPTQSFTPFDPLKALQPLLINPFGSLTQGLTGGYGGYNPPRGGYNSAYGGNNVQPNYGDQSSGYQSNGYQSNPGYDTPPPPPAYAPSAYEDRPATGYGASDGAPEIAPPVNNENYQAEPNKYDDTKQPPAEAYGDMETTPPQGPSSSTAEKSDYNAVVPNSAYEYENKKQPLPPQIVYQPIIYVSPPYQPQTGPSALPVESYTKVKESDRPMVEYQSELAADEYSAPADAYEPPAPQQVTPEYQPPLPVAPQPVPSVNYDQPACGQSYCSGNSQTAPFMAALYTPCQSYNVIPTFAALAVPTIAAPSATFSNGYHQSQYNLQPTTMPAEIGYAPMSGPRFATTDSQSRSPSTAQSISAPLSIMAPRLTLADQPYRTCPELFEEYHHQLAQMGSIPGAAY